MIISPEGTPLSKSVYVAETSTEVRWCAMQAGDGRITHLAAQDDEAAGDVDAQLSQRGETMTDELGEVLDIGPAIRRMAEEELAKHDAPERTPALEQEWGKRTGIEL